MNLESIARQFFDYQKLISAQPLGAGHINDTFLVQMEDSPGRRGKFKIVLQRINHHVFKQPEAVMHNIRLVAEHLAAQPSYPMQILRPLPTLSSEWFYCDEKGNYWRTFPFIENTVSIDKVDTAEQAWEAAKAFGAFTKALHGLAAEQLQPTIPGFHDGLSRLGYFKKVLDRALPDRLREARREVEEILQHQLIFNKIAGLGLPVRAVHHDTKINNVLLDKDTFKAVCVIDLDTVMPGIVLSDFGDMMRTFTSEADEDEADWTKVEMRMPVFKALSEGFLSEMSDLLTPAERENLAEGGRWLTLMQVTRFLADYLEGDVYYKTKYPEHNLVRSRNQLALFRSMKF